MAEPADLAGPVGFVGAGQMGGAMVERLLAAGRPVRLFARRPQVRERFAALGAQLADSPADLAAGLGVVVGCMFSGPQLLDVAVRGGLVAALPPGAVFVSHTTVDGVALDAVAEAAASCGAHLVDAPVSGTADDIRAGQLTVLLGGEPEPVARAEAVVSAYAGTLAHTGSVGSATRVKLVNNLLFAAQAQLVAAAVHLGRDLGLGDEDLLAALAVCSSNSNVLGHLRDTGSPELFGERVAPYMRKDLAAAASLAAALNVDIGLLGEVSERGPLNITHGAPQPPTPAEPRPAARA